jgi:hypothetical protein
MTYPSIIRFISPVRRHPLPSSLPFPNTRRILQAVDGSYPLARKSIWRLRVRRNSSQLRGNTRTTRSFSFGCCWQGLTSLEKEVNGRSPKIEAGNNRLAWSRLEGWKTREIHARGHALGRRPYGSSGSLFSSLCLQNRLPTTQTGLASRRLASLDSTSTFH